MSLSFFFPFPFPFFSLPCRISFAPIPFFLIFSMFSSLSPSLFLFLLFLLRPPYFPFPSLLIFPSISSPSGPSTPYTPSLPPLPFLSSSTVEVWHCLRAMALALFEFLSRSFSLKRLFFLSFATCGLLSNRLTTLTRMRMWMQLARLSD